MVPVYNPDGLAAGTRKNARGVDLNRNFPYHWANLDGNYESGPKPASEPETRAMMRFLRQVRPDWILSFHQPLQRRRHRHQATPRSPAGSPATCTCRRRPSTAAGSATAR